ncbi:hypothetical protein Val02_47040 [Virgisporangium aliadipatigenens]|uniref:Uncharacterized protein n=1 Tax=Virgisporangium aliadipatigenens TaxID=741659 RepID=A0A8J4DSF4_9ACTN|nr:hypothetical protein [Virgisporangium aliadipatigenens]GIJ47818.1 hypothetical protein Val02_47040 [Virgisporangium aliadipatigenens]
MTIVQGWNSRTQPREFFTDAAERIPHAARVQVRYVDGGHFWPLESPGQTGTILREGPRCRAGTVSSRHRCPLSPVGS